MKPVNDSRGKGRVLRVLRVLRVRRQVGGAAAAWHVVTTHTEHEELLRGAETFQWSNVQRVVRAGWDD